MHNTTDLLINSIGTSKPPKGSVNVRVGEVVEGPGGKWVPCVTRVGDDTYYSGLFQVGPGQHQVCATDVAMPCIETAFRRAVELASSAAA